MKVLKWIGIVLLAIVLLGYFVGVPYLREQTKKYSPEKTAQYSKDGVELEVTYCSPYKKDRKIFGGLVPYGQVWRTGANEPTTFTTNKPIEIAGTRLDPGTYSLWTIPNPDQWTFILNEEVPDWGVTLMSGGEKTSRIPESDVVNSTVAASELTTPQEQLLLEFRENTTGLYLSLSWDQTEIQVPINY